MNKKAARDVAKLSDAPYGTIYTTTAGRLDTKSGKYAYKILQGAAQWNEVFFDAANIELLIEMVRRNSSKGNKTVALEFNHRQLGYTDEWLKGKMEDAESDGIDAETDFLNIWASGTDTSPIDKNLLKLLKDSLVSDYYADISHHGYITRWYVPATRIESIKNNSYVVLSLDTSDAVGKDDIGLVVRDIKTGEVLAVGNYNETNIIAFSKWLLTWAKDFKNIIMIIERRSTGSSVMDYLIEMMPSMNLNPFKIIFNWVVEEKDMYPERYKKIDMDVNKIDPQLFVSLRKHFGYATGGSGRASRDNLYGGTLLSSIKYTGGLVRDKVLINQISGLTTRNGRIDHGQSAGDKDDLCIAWMLSYWWLINTKNPKYYGVEPRYILSSVITNDKLNADGKKVSIEKKHDQELIKLKIDKLIEFLKKENNDMKALLINNKIKQLSKELDEDLLSTFNIKSMLDEINEKRKLSKKFSGR